MKCFVVGNYMHAHFLNVPRLPNLGESVAATSAFREHGGKGLNLAVSLHKLGADVRLLMCIGRDDAGDSVVRRLAEMGMDTSGIRLSDAPSGFGVGFIAPDGGNFLSSFLGANEDLDPAAVRAEANAIAAARWTLGQFEAPVEAVRAAFRIARAAGGLTYLNPSPWREPDDDLLSLTDLLVMNESEATEFFRDPSLSNASVVDWVDALNAHPRASTWQGSSLVVTLGARGVVCRSRAHGVQYTPAYRIEQIDATGAGDAFGAGLVYALGRDETAHPMAYANACGAIVAERKGILDWLPTHADVQRFLDRPGLQRNVSL